MNIMQLISDSNLEDEYNIYSWKIENPIYYLFQSEAPCDLTRQKYLQGINVSAFVFSVNQ